MSKIVKDGKKTIKVANLVIEEDIEKLGYFRTIFETFKDILGGKLFY